MLNCVLLSPTNCACFWFDFVFLLSAYYVLFICCCLGRRAVSDDVAAVVHQHKRRCAAGERQGLEHTQGGTACGRLHDTGRECFAVLWLH